MREGFFTHNARDFRQRYNNSWGYFTTPSNKKLLVLMNGIGDKQADFSDEDGVSFHALVDQGVEFEFIPVTKKLFVYNDTLYYIRRRPARMWARGVNNQNTMLNIVSAKEGVYTDQGLTFAHIRAAFEKESFDPLQIGKKAYTLSSTFGVSEDVLFVYNEKIGTVEGENITLTTPIFRQEILDIIRKQGLTFKVANG